jgi:hypothetical protein
MVKEEIKKHEEYMWYKFMRFMNDHKAYGYYDMHMSDEKRDAIKKLPPEFWVMANYPFWGTSKSIEFWRDIEKKWLKFIKEIEPNR